MWEAPRIQRLGGERLHLQHGPIDVVLRAWGAARAVAEAEDAAAARFPAILPELVAELPELRKPMSAHPRVEGPIARRMVAACRPHARHFITPMAAVAGAVADHLLEIMTEAAPLDRAYVNDGGDIALHLTEGEEIALGLVGAIGDGTAPVAAGRAVIRAGDGIGGVATSGAQGRSFSLGIADAVTVLAVDAARADAAATLIANAVDCDDPRIVRRPASDLDPDSDLADRRVTVQVPPLAPDRIDAALARGLEQARVLRAGGLIRDAALTLQGRTIALGRQLAFEETHP